jgi:hypothetical protein
VKLIPLLMILTGALLLYSANKDEDPRNVVFEALGIKRRVAHATGVTTSPDTGRRSGGGTFGGTTYPTTTPGTTTVSV